MQTVKIKNMGKPYFPLIVIMLGLFLIFTTTFIFGRYASPTVFPRLFYFFSVSALLSIGAAGLLFRRKNIALTWTDIFVAAFLVYVTVQFVIKEGILYERFIAFILLGNLYFILRVYFSIQPGIQKVIYLLFVFTGIIQSIIGYLQLYGIIRSFHVLQPLTGSFFNPGPFAGYLGAILCMSFCFLVKNYERYKEIKSETSRFKFEFYSSLIFIGVALPLIPVSMSRSAWVAMLLTTISIFIIERKDVLRRFISNGKHKKIALVVASFFILSVCFYAVYHVKKDSADSRLYIWKNSIQIAKINPLTGNGLGSFEKLYAESQAEFLSSPVNEEKIAMADFASFPFNEPLHILLEFGFIGLILFLACIVSAFAGIWQRSSVFQYALISLLIFSLTSYPFRVLPIQILLVFCLAANSESAIFPKKISVVRPIQIFLFLVVVGIVVVYPYFNNQKKALKQWTVISANLYNTNNFEEAVKHYPRLLPALQHEIQYLFEYGRSLHMTGNYEESSEILNLISPQLPDPMAYNIIGNNFKKLGKYDDALEQYRLAFYYLPNRIYPLYLTALLYHEKSDTAAFLETSQRVINFDPKVESSATQELKAEMMQYYQELSSE